MERLDLGLQVRCVVRVPDPCALDIVRDLMHRGREVPQGGLAQLSGTAFDLVSIGLGFAGRIGLARGSLECAQLGAQSCYLAHVLRRFDRSLCFLHCPLSAYCLQLGVCGIERGVEGVDISAESVVVGRQARDPAARGFGHGVERRGLHCGDTSHQGTENAPSRGCRRPESSTLHVKGA